MHSLEVHCEEVLQMTTGMDCSLCKPKSQQPKYKHTCFFQQLAALRKLQEQDFTFCLCWGRKRGQFLFCLRNLCWQSFRFCTTFVQLLLDFVCFCGCRKELFIEGSQKVFNFNDITISRDSVERYINLLIFKTFSFSLSFLSVQCPCFVMLAS